MMKSDSMLKLKNPFKIYNIANLYIAHKLINIFCVVCVTVFLDDSIYLCDGHKGIVRVNIYEFVRGSFV